MFAFIGGFVLTFLHTFVVVNTIIIIIITIVVVVVVVSARQRY